MSARMDTPRYSHAHLRQILLRTRSIAAVGISTNPIRPSNYVGRYLWHKGFRMIPVNPRYAGETAFGTQVVGTLADIPPDQDPVQMVEIFRRSEEAGAVVDEALEALLPRGLETIWMQFGVVDHAAAARAEAEGVTVVMNRCPKIEHQRLHGELRIAGINTGVVSSKLDR